MMCLQFALINNHIFYLSIGVNYVRVNITRAKWCPAEYLHNKALQESQCSDPLFPSKFLVLNHNFNKINLSKVYISKIIDNLPFVCEDNLNRKNITVEIIQLRAKFQTVMVSCSRFIWITYPSDRRKVWTTNLLHAN